MGYETDFTALEKMWELSVPQNSYVVIRVDGKNFSKYTKKLRRNKPFSMEFTERMKRASLGLAAEFPMAKLIYTGSDEISILLHDLDEATQKPFGGRVQKLASISAAKATAHFNYNTLDTVCFDGRVIDLGNDSDLVTAYFKERYFSGITNSISMLASFYYGHNFRMGLSTAELRAQLERDGHSWNDIAPEHRFGVFFSKSPELKKVEYTRRDTGESVTTEVTRHVWKPQVLSSFAEFERFDLS